MSNSSLVTYTKISPNRTSPRNHVIDTITIHCVVGQCSAAAVLNLPHFVNYNASAGASCNYAVGHDGSIGLCVEEKDRSWCTSNRENDHRAITIEVASDTKHPYAVNATAYKALIALLVDICKRNPTIGKLKWKGDKSLIGHPELQNMTVHRWFANKECPGEYLYSRHAQIAAEVNTLLGEEVVEAVPTPEKKPEPVSTTLKVGDLVSISPDATFYNGSEVSNWVLNRRWFIKKITGDRVVIDKSEDGKNAINSPVAAKFLSLVVPDKKVPYIVRSPNLPIYKSASKSQMTGKMTGKGLFTIVKIQNGFGYLKSGMGWIELEAVTEV